MTNSNIRVFLYGSCVSRDTAELRVGSWGRLAYVARQSLISATNPPILLPQSSGLTSKFQNAMLEGDFASSLFGQLREHGPNVDRLVIDLVDERLGVYPYESGGFLTFSNELHRSDLMNKIKGRQTFLEFGSDDHFDLWARSAEELIREIARLGLTTSTRIIRVPFVDRTVDGDDVTLTRGLTASEWNNRYVRYYDYLASHNLKIVTLPDDSALSTATHKWGAAQYHFVASGYESLARQIEAE